MASTSLSRTVTTQGNRQIGTFSAWIKNNRVDGTNNNQIWSAYYDGQNFDALYFNPENKLTFYVYEGGTGAVFLRTNAVYRDVSAWYHIVLKIDTTQATASDRVVLYVNGEAITSLEQNTYPTLNKNLDFNLPAFVNRIGDLNGTASNYFNGSMAHVHWIDGTAYDASAFGETDATTGIWKPKTAPSVTYGTNGFFLKFENSGSMGTDSSGNANNFTVNGTMTQTIDTPSNVFATLNPLNPQSNIAYSNGNTTLSKTGSAHNSSFGNLAISKGKYYWEAKAISVGAVSILGIISIDENLTSDFNYSDNSTAYSYKTSGLKGNGGTDTAYGDSWTSNDIISIALDLDNNYIYFAKNGVWQNSGDPTSGASGTGSAFSVTSSLNYCPACNAYSSGSGFQFNFGNGYFSTTAVSSAENPDDGIGIFEYDVPTGYKALCTKSINAQEYS